MVLPEVLANPLIPVTIMGQKRPSVFAVERVPHCLQDTPFLHQQDLPAGAYNYIEPLISYSRSFL